MDTTDSVKEVPAADPGRSYTKRLLSHPDLQPLPTSVPLIIPNDCEYDFSTNQLVCIEGETRKSLKMVPQALQLLESIDKPIAMLGICGPCRTGKSYILSRVLGSADAFALGHTMDPKTFGIWIGTSVLECDEFTLLLMDTEGIDAVSATMKNDASVLVMTALLSSFLVYNSLNVPKHSDLEKMSHFAQLATSIAVKDVTGKSSEEDDAFELRNYFPDFLWLLRDVTLLPTDKSGKPISASEYLKTKVLKRSTRSFKPSESDEVARAILTVFPSIECSTVRPPSSDPEVMQDIVSKQDCLDPQFNQEVEEVAQYLLQHVKPKKGVLSGKVTDGPILATMATHYLEAVNNPDAIPCIADTWQAAVKMKCDKVMSQLLVEYENDMESHIAKVGLPMEDDSPDDDTMSPHTLMGLHRFILQQKTKSLLSQVGHFVAASATASGSITKENLIADLDQQVATFNEEPTGQMVDGKRIMRKKVSGGILLKFCQRNFEDSRKACCQLFDELYASIESKLSQKGYDFDAFKRDLEKLQISYYSKAVGPAKWEVYNEKKSFIKTQESSFKHLQGFKKVAFEEQMKAAEAAAAAAKAEEDAKEAQAQYEKDAELYKARIEELEDYNQKELSRIEEEQEEKIANENQKYLDFMSAQMVEMAGMVKENIALVKEQLETAKAMVKDATTQNAETVKALKDTTDTLAETIKNMPRKGGCFIPGTKVTCTDGSELVIEKQTDGIKLLAIGGETTTITQEYVRERMEAGEKLFGINDDTPFAALHHPFWTTDGWKSLDPEFAKQENPTVDFKLLQVGDVVFRIAQINPLLYEPVKIRQFTFTTLEQPIMVYGLHLDGPRSYHANGYVVAANYPVLTKKRVSDGLKKLTEEEKERLVSSMTAAQSELSKVLGSWADHAFKDMGLVSEDLSRADGYRDCI